MARIEDCSVGTVVRHEAFAPSQSRIIGRRIRNTLEGDVAGMDRTHPTTEGPDWVHIQMEPPIPHKYDYVHRVGCAPRTLILPPFED